MLRSSAQGVDPLVCCTPGCYCYICKRQLCGFTGWALCLLEGGSRYPGCYCYICKRQFLWIHPVCCVLSRGGAQTHWHQSYMTKHDPLIHVNQESLSFIIATSSDKVNMHLTLLGVNRLSAWPIIGADIKHFTDYRYRPFSKQICR